jgi:hypothetical protein
MSDSPEETEELEDAHLTIKITLRKGDGAIKSVLVPSTIKDAQTLVGWPSGGLHQSCHALLQETVRQEAFTMYLHRMSHGEDPESIPDDEMEAAVRHHLVDMLAQYTADSVQDAKERANAIPAEARPEPLPKASPSGNLEPVMDPDAKHAPQHKH